MTQQQYESGWENPDQHPDLAQRQRPMFDAQGRQVDTAPPPDPAPELDRMGLFGEPLMNVPDVLTDVTVGEGKTAGVPLVKIELTDDAHAQARRLAEIRSVAEAGLNDASPAGWAVALDRIVGLTK